ncbi:Hypothetical predicted protein [Mytilus galloprovincialis]|uniref:Uncharacterized protein n=1 Tax=Mytilus galloprovincialis TaxID=29158 RepID=A0A8B6F8T3_MYTGA|nr:Hypothetical predicted protein [Mytilus galloprovincialis]
MKTRLIQVPIDIGVQDKTESASVSSCSRTSKSSSPSNRSYLEVVDYSLYLKPYEILQCHRDSDFVHLYSTTANKSEYKSDSSSTESSTCPQRNCRSELKQESVINSPEQSSFSNRPISLNESTANHDSLLSEIKVCGATKTPTSVIEMDCMDISDKAKTVTHSLLKPISNYQDMPDAKSYQPNELPSSSNSGNAMSTIL